MATYQCTKCGRTTSNINSVIPNSVTKKPEIIFSLFY